MTQINAAKVSVAEIGAAKIGVPKLTTAEIAIAQIGAVKCCTGQVHVGKVDATKMGPHIPMGTPPLIPNYLPLPQYIHMFLVSHSRPPRKLACNYFTDLLLKNTAN